uniref:Uncharacterized protein n=1 Tax=Davidia involucrata TaxID=16924 RepID=A0A5B7BFC7_DAVIN
MEGVHSRFAHLYCAFTFTQKVTDESNSCGNVSESQFDTDITLLPTRQGSDDGWSCCNFHVPDSKLSASYILCRHTVATLRLYVYSQLLLLHGQILLVFSWSQVILTEPFNIIRKQ